MRTPALACLVLLALPGAFSFAQDVSPDDVLRGLREFYDKTARADGSFQPGIDPEYLGMSDSAYSDLAAVTYAATIHKTFGWKLPREEQTIEFLLSRQQESGDFVNVAGTVDPKSPQGRVYNTTQALVALRALGVKPRRDPLPVFEEILKQDYKTLPAYSTSFFPLAYLCAGKPIPEQADRAIRALMIPDEDGYLNNHIAATFHSSHYYALVGEPTPMSRQMVRRILRDQNDDGSWLLNAPARDRHATFDAVFTLKHEAPKNPKAQEAIRRAATWALSCRNPDGGFGHYPGSTSDADAIYFQVGTLVMAGFLKPVDPLPNDPHLLSWGHLMPARTIGRDGPRTISLTGWAGGVAYSPDGKTLAIGTADGKITLWDAEKRRVATTLEDPGGVISSVAFIPGSESLVSGSYNHTATIWDLKSEKPQHVLEGHRGAITNVAASPDGSTIATASLDQTIRLWEAKTGKLQRTLRGHKSWVNSIVFHPEVDNEVLFSGSSDGTVCMWNLNTGEVLRKLTATDGEVRCVAISPNGRTLATGLRYGTTKLWDLDNFGEIGVLEQKADDVWSVAFTDDGRRLLTAAGDWNRPTRIALWDVAARKQVGEFQHTGEVLSLAVSPDRQHFAAGGADHAVSIWTVK